MTKLFSPVKLRGLTLPNRIMVAPMCQYSAENGAGTAWHLHIRFMRRRSIGGARPAGCGQVRGDMAPARIVEGLCPGDAASTSM